MSRTLILRPQPLAVWKFELRIADRQNVLMPEGWKTVRIEMQRGVVCLWAMVSSSSERRLYEFRCFGTGHSIVGPLGDHVGSVLTEDGAFVWHYFEGDHANARARAKEKIAEAKKMEGAGNA